MDKSTQELLHKLRFTYSNNGSGYNSDFTLTLQKAADLIEELTKEPMNKTQWFPIETVPNDCEPFDVWNGYQRYTDCTIGKPKYSGRLKEHNKIIYKDSIDCDGDVWEEVKDVTNWTRFTPPEASSQWLIRKEPNTKDMYYVVEGTPPDDVLMVYGIVKG